MTRALLVWVSFGAKAVEGMRGTGHGTMLFPRLGSTHGQMAPALVPGILRHGCLSHDMNC